MMANVSFAETPEHKCAHVFKGEDGNFFAYPNNRIVWFDRAFTENRIKENPGYIIDQNVYAVEGETYYESNDNFQTEFNKKDLK